MLTAGGVLMQTVITQGEEATIIQETQIQEEVQALPTPQEM